MMDFREFDNVEEAFEWMRRNEEAANAHLTEEQKSVGYGDHFVRLWNNNVAIYGYVLTREELETGELEAGASPEEAENTLRMMDDAYARGYRFSRCYSEWCPEGELGDTHVASMGRKISREEFEEAVGKIQERSAW